MAAGRGSPVIRSFLQAHVNDASTDQVKRERIAVVGDETPATSVQQFETSGLNNDRMVFTAPGLQAVDASRHGDDPAGITVNLTSAYTAAAVAGMIGARDPQVSLTHQSVAAPHVEWKFNAGELEQLILKNVLAIEERQDVRVVKAITTDTGAFTQITTRRIVDYARNGVRNTAEPYIGLLNNDRVRKALKGAINGFLASMVDNEQLEVYDLDVAATRDQEIRGIAIVTMTLQPTFSIDYIQVVMYLQ